MAVEFMQYNWLRFLKPSVQYWYSPPVAAEVSFDLAPVYKLHLK